jgi:glyoxylase-like metal-dependent hydrolase (beta-lactamase superfamily II)
MYRAAALPLALLAVVSTAGGYRSGHDAPSIASGPTQDTSRTPKWCAGQPRRQYASLTRVPVRSTWFQVYQVDPGVYAIYEPHQWEEVISYLIVGNDRALLFDTGMGIADIRAVAEQLTRLPIEVMNSHTHPDHIGDNWEFDRILGLDTQYTRDNAGGYSHAAVAGEVAADHFCAPPPAGFDTASYRTRPFHITQIVADGSVIGLGSRQLAVLHIPGHAPDAVALFDAEHGELFTGDTFYEGPIFVFARGADFEAFTRSADRLATLVPRLRKLLTAHNIAVSNPVLLLRLRDAVHAIGRGSVTGTADNGIVTYDFGAFSVMVRKRA